MNKERKWEHFTTEEVEGLQTGLVDMLDEARELAEIPFIITSGYRTPERNDALPDSAKNSAHLYGLAVDLMSFSSVARFRIVKSLLEVGFNRIGIYEKHIHVDVDESKPEGVMWYA